MARHLRQQGVFKFLDWRARGSLCARCLGLSRSGSNRHAANPAGAAAIAVCFLSSENRGSGLGIHRAQRTYFASAKCSEYASYPKRAVKDGGCRC